MGQAGPLVQPVGHLVGVDADVSGQVDHGLDHHLGVRTAAPVADLARSDQPNAAGALDPADRVAPGHGILGQVYVDHDLAGTVRRFGWWAGGRLPADVWSG